MTSPARSPRRTADLRWLVMGALGAGLLLVLAAFPARAGEAVGPAESRLGDIGFAMCVMAAVALVIWIVRALMTDRRPVVDGHDPHAEAIGDASHYGRRL